MQVGSAEYTVVRTYIDWLLDMPWSRETTDNLDIAAVRKVLDEDHYGLDKVKKRIVEYLAVRKLKKDKKGPILCLLGPPGVGKTSLGRSIAEALGRKFVRISLGGVHDEAAIRGHRRTYVGALPGQHHPGHEEGRHHQPGLHARRDRQDGHDFRGDPAAALLEVLDPEQNDTFSDHYLEMPVRPLPASCSSPRPTWATPSRRRSATAWRSSRSPATSAQEKLEIARRHLVRVQRDKHGLQKEQLSITVAALRKIVRDYTREAGVRGLDRLIAKLCRKVAAKIAKEEVTEVKIGPDEIEVFLGPPQYIDEMISRGQAPGIAAGLAWTPVGGEVLFVETTRMPGRGRLKLTGKLGDVMSESVQIAFSYVRANARKLGIEPKIFDESEFHVHFPAGAVPKDGPSAGITVVTSILSLLRQKSVPARLAMTGEITLMGNVLPVGGIKEKVIAARRAGARRVILPQRNQKDLVEVPEHVARGLQFSFVETYDDVERIIFSEPDDAPAPKKTDPSPSTPPTNNKSTPPKRKKPRRGPPRAATLTSPTNA
jgi:ATP-dependent Lon protease